MEKIFNLLKLIDISSVTYGFHINGQQSYKTGIGGILYLGLIIFIFYYLILFSIEFFSRSNYNIIKFEKFLTSPVPINISKNNLNFGFSLQDDEDLPLQKELMDRYFITKLRYVTKTSTGKKVENINLIECKEDSFKNEFNKESNYFKNKNYLNHFCLENSNYTIRGAYNDALFSYFDYSISLNWTAVKEENMDFKNNFYSKKPIKIIFKYFEYSIDVDNVSEPIKAFESEVFDYINFSRIKKNNLDFSLIDFQDDKDFLFSKSSDPIQITKLIHTSDYYFSIYDRNPDINDYQLLYILFIRSSFNYHILKRIYLKLPDYLAHITGITSYLLFLVILFAKFYNSFKSREEIINLLLRFKENFDKGDPINIKINNLNILYKQRFFDDKLNNSNLINKEVGLFNKDISFINNKAEDNYLENDKEYNNKNGIVYTKTNINKKNNLNDNYKYLISNEIIEVQTEKNDILTLPYKECKEYLDYKNCHFINEDIKIDNNPINTNDLIIENEKNENNQNFYSIESCDIKRSPIIFSNEKFNDILKKKTLDKIVFNKRFSLSDAKVLNRFNRNIFQINKISTEENREFNSINSANNVIFHDDKNSVKKSSIKSNNSRNYSLIEKIYDANGHSLIFDFSVFEIFCRPLFKCSKNRGNRMSLYKKAFHNIDNYLNIFVYLKVIQEIEIMKNALFSNQETIIIDFVAKPMISEEDNEEIFLKKDTLKNKLIYEKNLNEVLKAYEIMLKKDKIGDKSKYLMKFLNNELIKLSHTKE